MTCQHFFRSFFTSRVRRLFRNSLFIISSLTCLVNNFFKVFFKLFQLLNNFLETFLVYQVCEPMSILIFYAISESKKKISSISFFSFFIELLACVLVNFRHFVLSAVRTHGCHLLYNPLAISYHQLRLDFSRFLGFLESNQSLH